MIILPPRLVSALLLLLVVVVVLTAIALSHGEYTGIKQCVLHAPVRV
jgi:hypothetical protein